MNVTITVNIGLTDQLAGFLTKLVGAAPVQHTSEALVREAPKAVVAEPVEAGRVEAGEQTTAVVEQTAPVEKPKRGAAKKAEPAPAADPFAAPASSAGATALGVGDAFSEQIKTANASAAAERAEKADEGAPTYTVKDLNDAAAAAMAKVGAPGVKAILEENFKAADGSSVDRLSAVQPSDYADAIAKLREAA